MKKYILSIHLICILTLISIALSAGCRNEFPAESTIESETENESESLTQGDIETLIPNAQKLLNYLSSMGNGRYVSGQVGNWHTFEPEYPDPDDETNWVRKVELVAGYRPAIQTVTYALGTELWQHNNPPYWPMPWDWNPVPSNEALKNIWDSGGIPAAFIVWANPENPDRGLYGPCDVDKIFDDGINDIKSNFYRQMDFIADQMQWLNDHDIPVIFHPFVELDDAGKWHASAGEENAKNLHRLVYNYFTNEKGLNNLIWVYYVAYPPRVESYYPGDDYVDVIGISAYMKYNESLDSKILDSQWNWMKDKNKNRNKILALAEVGLRMEDEPYADALKLLDSLDSKYPEISFFNFWKDNWYTIIDNDNGKELLSDTRIITQGNTGLN